MNEGQQFSVPVQSWPAGVYFIRLINETSAKSYTQKIIVQ
jgi:hypothetical protein